MKFKKLLFPLIILIFIFLFTFIATERFTKVSSPAPSPQIEQLKYIDVPITINYQEEGKSNEAKIASVKEDTTAWEATKKAIGEENLEYKDYGGDLGIFISAINNVKPTGNKFWLFKVNGQGADIGVSSYKLKQGDQIEFVISEPKEENQ